MSGTSPLRVGGIDYLNALPLLYGLSDDGGEPPFEVSHHVPSRLASMLRADELDVALVPVVEYPERDDYVIVPAVGISSYGGVHSIRLFHRKPLRASRRVALDACSRTSQLLTRLLFREVWGAEPEFVEMEPGEVLRSCESGSLDAALLIGDAALRGGLLPGWDVVDLGTEWTRWTGLPFVYAFWVARSTPGKSASADRNASLVSRFVKARDAGLAHVDEIVEHAELPEGMSAGDALRYLGHLIHYDLGDDKLAALRLFFERLGACSLLPQGRCELRFIPRPAEAPS